MKFEILISNRFYLPGAKSRNGGIKLERDTIRC